MTQTRITPLILLALLLAACAPAAAPPVPTSPPPAKTEPPSALRGRVIDFSGQPIARADVSTASGHALSDADGWFSLPGVTRPEWVTVRSEGFITRTRAAAPEAPVLFRLMPDDGETAAILFGGDTMLGRRFFDPNADGNTSDGLLPTHPTVGNALGLLQPVQPILENADLAVLNLEGPLADPAYLSPRDPRPAVYHSSKDYVFASPTITADALRQSGVDVVDIGNNHLYDLLETGLHSTLSTLDLAGVMHFGAGTDEDSAWAPVLLKVKGQTIALLGCTTIPKPIPPITGDDVLYVASDALKKGGAARCQSDRLTKAVTEARSQADIVVVMIHGGEEYNPSATAIVSQLTKVARAAGATLVINHHPHVIGGFSWNGKALVARSLGNFMFDQTIWPTFQAYTLTVYLRQGKVIGASVDPLMLEGFVPHGLPAELGEAVIRQAAGLAPGPFVMEDGSMQLLADSTAELKTKTAAMDGGAQPGTVITLPAGQWISNFSGSGRLRLGRDLLWIGGFESPVVGHTSPAPPLWNLGAAAQAGPEFAYEGAAGIRLIRGANDRSEVVTTHERRILVRAGDSLSVIGMVRLSADAHVRLQVSWYPDTSGSSSMQTVEPISVEKPNEWQPIRLDVSVPAGIVAMGLFLRLSPPTAGIVSADFDNLRILDWAAAGAQFSPLYGFGLLSGAGDVTFSQQVLPGGEAWLTLR